MMAAAAAAATARAPRHQQFSLREFQLHLNASHIYHKAVDEGDEPTKNFSISYQRGMFNLPVISPVDESLRSEQNKLDVDLLNETYPSPDVCPNCTWGAWHPELNNERWALAA